MPSAEHTHRQRKAADDGVAIRRRIRIVILGLPVVMAALIIGGVFIGFYLSDLLGDEDSILLPILFATLGFGVSIAVSLYVAKIVVKPSRRSSRDTAPLVTVYCPHMLIKYLDMVGV